MGLPFIGGETQALDGGGLDGLLRGSDYRVWLSMKVGAYKAKYLNWGHE